MSYKIAAPTHDNDNLADLAAMIIQVNLVSPDDSETLFNELGVANACIDVLANAFTQLQTNVADYPRGLAQTHPLFTAHLPHWALTLQTDDSLRSTKTRWMRCGYVLQKNNKLYSFHTHKDHRMTAEEMEDQLQSFMDSLFELLIELAVGLQAIPRAFRKMLKSDADPFSSSSSSGLHMQSKNSGLDSLAKCLALVPQSLVRSCLAWLNIQPSLICWGPISILYIALRSLAGSGVEDPNIQLYFQTLDEYPNFSTNLTNLLRHLVHRYIDQSAPPKPAPPDLDYHCEQIIRVVDYIASLAVFNLQVADLTIRAYFTPHASTMFTSLFDIIDNLETALNEGRTTEDAVDELLPLLVMSAKSMYPAVKHHLPEASHIYSQLERRAELPIEYASVMKLLDTINRLQSMWSCLNRSCFPHSMPGTATQRCTGCLLFTYCSKDCQKIAWLQAPHPHKATCKKLRVLRSVWSWDTQKSGIQRYIYNLKPKDRRIRMGPWLVEMLEEIGFKEEELAPLVLEIASDFFPME